LLSLNHNTEADIDQISNMAKIEIKKILVAIFLFIKYPHPTFLMILIQQQNHL